MSEDASAVSAGRLLLDVVADVTGLAADLKAKLDAISRDLKVQVTATVVADAAKARADIDEAAKNRTAKIKADTDTAKAQSELDALTKARIARYTAQAETAKAKADLAAVAAQERTAQIIARAEVAKAKIDLDAVAQAERVARIAAKADAAQAKADLDAVAKDRAAAIKAVAQNVAQAKAALDDAAKDRTAKIKPVAAATTAAKAELDRVAADRVAQIKAGTSGLAEASAEIDAVARDRTVTIKAKADTSALLATIGKAGGTAANISMPVLIGGGLADAVGLAGNLAGGLVAVAGAASQAAGIIGALPGLLAGAASGAAVLKLGFSGISAAVGAMSASQTGAAASAQSMAAAQQSAANTVRTSAQGLAAAQISAVQSVSAAQHTLQQDVVATADAQYNALQSVSSAEHSLTDAQFTETQGQIALTAARLAARQNLVQMSYDLRGAVLDEAQATLTLQEAQIKLAETNQSAAATPQEKAQAALDVKQAQLALDEAKTKITTTAQAKALADKQGVDGSAAVTSAVHAQADAVYSLQNAQQAAARAQMLAARSVSDAEYAQAQAGQALTNARTSAATQLENAQIGYTQALAAAKNPLLGVSSQTTALANALKALSPAGREFADFVYQVLEPKFKDLKFAVQDALLPPVQQGVTDALPLLGTLKDGLTGTATVMGGFAVKLGQFLGSAASQADLSSVMKVNDRAFTVVGDAVLRILDALRTVTVTAEPLITGIAGMAGKVAKSIDSATQQGLASGGLARFFHDAWVSAVLLGKIVWNILDGIGHIFKAGDPAGTSLLGSLEKATGTFKDWTGSGDGQAKLKAFFDNTVPVVKQFADLIVHAGKVLGPFLDKMGGGQYSILFGALNDLLGVLNDIVKIPALGTVINWIIALSLVGVGLGKVAGNISGIAKGLSTLAKITGLSKLFSSDEGGAVAGMQAAGNRMFDASVNMLRAAGLMPAESAEAGAAGAGEGAAVAGGSGIGAVLGSLILPAVIAAVAVYMASKIKVPGGGSLLAPKQGDLGVGGVWWDDIGAPVGGGPGKPKQVAQSVTSTGFVTPGSTEATHQSGAVPMAWSTAYEAFQRDFAGKITAWFTTSLPDVITRSIPRWFAGVWDNFDRDVVHKVTDWVTGTLPDTFTHSVPGWFDAVWGDFQSAVIAPVRGWVTVTLPAFFTATIPRWFDSVVTWFTVKVADPVKTFVTATVPGWFTQTIPGWFRSADGWFTRQAADPVKSWVTVTLPGFFTSTIPHWFDSAKASFTAHVETPITSFFTGTLPGVIEGAFKGGYNWIIGKINSLTSHIPGIGSSLNIPKLAKGGIVPGRPSRTDNQLAGLRSGEGGRQPGATAALGGPRFINWANRTFGDVPVGSGGDGHYAGGGIIPNPIGVITHVAHDVASAVGGVIGDVARLVPGVLRSGFDHLWSAVISPEVSTMPHWGMVGDLGVEGIATLKGAIDSFLGARDVAGVSGSVGAGSGAEVAKYAASFATGRNHPYVTGGQNPNSWDCSGFSAWVYEHYGYFPGGQKVRHGTSESQFADPLLQPGSAVPGALVFFDDGFYANPGHVGVVVNPTTYAGADSPSVGTVLASLAGNVGFRIPKGGFRTSTPGHGLIPANAAAIASYLIGQGASKIAAAGILGNVLQESGGQPGALQAGGPGGGLIQITGDPGGSLSSELLKTLNYINAQGLGGLADINRHSPDPATSALYFSNTYERPNAAYANNARRVASAQASYAAGYDQGGPVHPGANWLLNSTGRDEWVLTPAAVDALGGAGAVHQLNMTAGLYAGAASQAAAVSAGGRGGAGGRPTVNVFPQPGMSEEHVGAVAARKLGVMLA